MISCSSCSIILHSQPTLQKLPSPATLRLRVLLFPFPTLPSKPFSLIENSSSFIIKSTPHHTPTPHTCILPILHYLLLTEKSEYIPINAIMNFVCTEVTHVTYEQTLLPLHASQPSAKLFNIFHNISSESIILRFIERRTYTLLPNFNVLTKELSSRKPAQSNNGRQMPNSFPDNNLENILDFKKKVTGNPSQ